jgi:predicted GNAT family acetyltransferase
VTPADRDLLVEWCGAFLAAAVPHQPGDPADAADQCLAEPGGTWLWVDRGVPVALARFGNPTPNSARISLVYTPDAHRGRGYASALVAAMTQHLLDAGWAFTTLLADRANPVATRIYRRMGYAPVADSHTWWFTGT